MGVKARKNRSTGRDEHRAAASPGPGQDGNARAATGLIGDDGGIAADRCLAWTDWLFAAALVAGVFLVYRLCWHGGFVFDDDLLLLNNPVLKPGGLAKVWVPGGYLNYWPITYTAYWLQHELWGLEPLGYHLVNLALHAIAALLVWRVLVRLQVPGAMFAAAIFGLHPVNVESVAWIAELKGILAVVFALVSVLFYLGNEQRPSRWRYALAIVAFLLSALSKGTAVTLPAVLLACAWWQRGRIDRRDVLRVVPYFLIAVVMAGVEVWAQHFVAAGEVIRSDDFFSRLAVAGCALWFYLGKLIFPIGLCPIYPRWTLDEHSALSYLPGVAWIALLVLAWWQRRTWGRPVVMLIVCYSALLLPVLGFVNITFMKYSLVADHWQYVATIVPCAVFAGVGTTLARRFLEWPVIIGAIAAGGALLIALAVLSFLQSGMYADAVTFYETTIARNPGCWSAHDNLGTVLLGRGENAAAILHYQKAMKLNPDRAEIYNNLALALAASGKVDSAIADFQRALAMKPNYAQAHFNLGDARIRRGEVELAIEEYQKAIEIDPAAAGTYCNLAAALAGRGQFDAAVAEYHKAFEIDPDSAEAHCSLGKVLYGSGRFDAALAEYQRALDINPNYAEAHGNLATALARRGQVAPAIVHYQKAIELKPDYAEAQGNLGAVLFADGQVNLAIAHYRKALELKPDYAEAHCNLANALASRREFDSAITEYEKALAIKPDYTAARQNLAAVRSARERLLNAQGQSR